MELVLSVHAKIRSRTSSRDIKLCVHKQCPNQGVSHVGGITEACQVDDGDKEVVDLSTIEVEPEYRDLQWWW